MSKSESSQSDKQRLAAELADEIEPQIGAITHVSLSRAERELVVEALRALSAPSAGVQTFAVDIPTAIRGSTWKTPELRESAAKLVEAIING